MPISSDFFMMYSSMRTSGASRRPFFSNVLIMRARNTSVSRPVRMSSRPMVSTGWLMVVS